jgi:biofilm protein TabA
MIQTTIDNARRYLSLCPRLGELLQYVKSHDMTRLPAGRIELDGERLFINIGESQLIAHEARKLEVHRRYIDVHLPLNGSEIIGWSPLSALGEPDAPFDAQKDFAFYTQLAQVYTNVTPGQCFIAFPEDAHAPLIGFGTLRKAVGKILIE